MAPSSLTLRRFAPDLSFALLALWLVVLWIAGGSSRGDVPGQLVTRAAAWAILIAAILFARRPAWRSARPVVWLVGAAVLLAALQLLALPPDLWMALPGRSLLADAATASGQDQPWRPWSISPGATRNALGSLIVPVVTLVLALALRSADHRRTAGLLLGLVVASFVLGLLQATGASLNHPLINDVPGMVSASFANRNHFALFCAIGCVLAPGWAFGAERQPRWRVPVAFGLIVVLGLIILATGSRAGLILGAAGIVLGLLSVRSRVQAELARLPRWARIALVAAAAAFAVTVVVVSIGLDRASSVDRALSLETADDLRSQALPVVTAMIGKYFPAGAGIGTFDAAYRIDEPFDLLNQRYFNHAHSDLLEVVLESGIAGLLLLGAAVAWWLWRSVAAWRADGRPAAILARSGSAIVLLVLLASAADYPARTPMIMAVVVLAAVWLCEPASRSAQPSQPAARG